MNALKILDRGHQNLLDALKDLPEESWTEGFVTGSWTVRDVVNHLGIYEVLQAEAFRKFLDPNIETPLLDEKAEGTFLEFNSKQEGKNKGVGWQEVKENYLEGFAELRKIVAGLTAEVLDKPNTTKWYGDNCALNDIIALNFGHKKHHIAQVKLFRQNKNENAPRKTGS